MTARVALYIFISILRSFITIDKYNNLYNVSSFIYL